VASGIAVCPPHSCGPLTGSNFEDLDHYDGGDLHDRAGTLKDGESLTRLAFGPFLSRAISNNDAFPTCRLNDPCCHVEWGELAAVPR
jgi:hypothetical protein